MIYTLVLIAHTQNHTAHKIQGMVNLARIYMCSKAMKSVQFWVTLLLVLCQRFLYSQWFCLNKQNPVYQQKGSPHLQFSPKKNVSFRAEVGSNFKCKSAQEWAQDCVSLKRAYGKFVGELLGTPATLIGAFEGLDVAGSVLDLRQPRRSKEIEMTQQFMKILLPSKCVFCSKRQTYALSWFTKESFIFKALWYPIVCVAQ